MNIRICGTGSALPERKITNDDLSQIMDTSDGDSYIQSASGLISNIIATQSTNVDTVSGATYSSVGIIEAVRNALSQAAISSDGNSNSQNTNSSSNGNGQNSNNNSSDNTTAVTGKYIKMVITGSNRGTQVSVHELKAHGELSK